MTDLLLEIYTEEIPSRLQKNSEKQLLTISKKIFNKFNIETDINTFVSPNRLVLFCNEIPQFVHNKEQTITGPKINAPTQAIEGFIKKYNTTKEILEEENGRFIITVPATETATKDVLPTILIEILEQMSTTWESGLILTPEHKSWIRPIRNILCILNNETINFSFGNIKSSNETYSDTIYQPTKMKIGNSEDYFILMTKNNVVLSRDKRTKEIIQQIQAICKLNNLTLNYDEQENIIEEVSGITSKPNVVLGNIPNEYISTLPENVITTLMKKHQKYIPLINNTTKTLSNKFAFVTDVKISNELNIIHGNERVLKARLKDAKFFYESDINRTEKDLISKLKKLQFHKDLGSIYDELENIEQIFQHIVEVNKLSYKKEYISELIKLSKLDLVSEMVDEFPELQGEMGGAYSIHWSKSNQFSVPIKEHYLPVGKNDQLPSTEAGLILSMADKLNYIIRLYEVGDKPTSSADPLGIRRKVSGIIRIIEETHFDIDLSQICSHKNIDEIIQLFINRSDNLKIFKQGQAFVTTSILKIIQKIDELNKIISSNKMHNVIKIYKRISGLIQDDNKHQPINQDLLNTSGKKLYQSIQDIQKQINRDDVVNIISQYSEMENIFENFFNETIIMDKSPEISNNNIALLHKCFEYLDHDIIKRCIEIVDEI